MARLRVIAIAWIVGVLALLGLAGPASAEDGDVIRTFDIAYTVNADGTLGVVENIDYQFAESGRHGIYRNLVIRQPFGPDSDDDVLYTLDDVTVDSPDAPDTFTSDTDWSGSRTRYQQLKIGSESATISGSEAHYTIAYTVTGALRTIDGIPELYWNATGSEWDARIEQVRITVDAPQGTTSLSCYYGDVGATTQCVTSTDGTTAVFEHSGLDSGQGVTISAQLPVGSVQNASPVVVPKNTWQDRARLGPVQLGIPVLLALLSVLFAVRTHRVNRDLRFDGVPPGVVDESAPVVVNTLADDKLPVQFNEPPMPAEIGGKLIDSMPAGRTTAATIAALGHLGVIGITATPDDSKKFRKTAGLQRTAQLRDASRCATPYQRDFVAALFPDPNGGLALDKPERAQAQRFAKAAQALDKTVGKELQRLGWRHTSFAWGWVALAILLAGICFLGTAAGASFLGWGVLLYTAPLLIVILALVYVAVAKARGRRTAVGRAYADQVEGFKKYLSTAEAGQLRFEEGEDIFSKYLPWAIAFDVADRWQRVCSKLAQAGQIPSSPSWYSGPAFYASYSDTPFGSSLSTSMTTSSSSSSGSSGGGSSGGGGGGGGGGSW